MRKRSLLGSTVALALTAIAGGFPAASRDGTVTVNPNAAVTVPTGSAKVKAAAEQATPVAIPTVQAIDLAFTGRAFRSFRGHEPIWIGYERPRRHWQKQPGSGP